MSELPSLAEFMGLTEFRSANALPSSFGIVSLFPKDFTGLGSVQPTTSDTLRNQTLLIDAPLSRDTVETLIARFQDALQQVNQQVKLSSEQVEFAEAGFADMLWHVFYARVNRREVATEILIEEFVQASLHLSSEDIAYEHHGQLWRIGTVSSVFGRVGLRVTLPHAIAFVRDERYLCPMEGFMKSLVVSCFVAKITSP